MSVHDSEPAFTPNSHLDLQADVLVIGGAAAGTWAAWSAASHAAQIEQSAKFFKFFP